MFTFYVFSYFRTVVNNKKLITYIYGKWYVCVNFKYI